MTTILLIHGINNQYNSKENIEKTWGDAIRINAASAGFRIPNNVKFRAAFYGDILDEETKSWKTNKPVSSPMSVSSPDEDYADEEIAALYLEFQKKYGISDDQISKELDIEDNDQTKKRMAKGIHKTWLKAIARALEKVLPAKGKKVVKAFISQAAAYLHKPGLKEKIDDLVREQILVDLPQNENIIIVSHSLGTVVAYDLLRRLRHELNVKLFITAGSPLGIEIVKRRLGPPLICLPNVDKWVNLSDKEDFVALTAKLTGKNFGCDEIRNEDNLDNGKNDAHDVLQYLSHKVVAKQIMLNI